MASIDLGGGQGRDHTRDPPRKLPRLTQDQLRRIEDEQGRTFYYLQSGKPVCGRLRKAKNRQIPNEACLAVPTARGPCTIHGGKSPGGQLTAGGRYARVPSSWKPAFERALKDEELLDTRRDLALMDSAIQQLLDRIDEADCPAWRAELQAIYQNLDAAVRSGKQRQVGPLLKALGEKIDEGAKVDAAVNDLLKHVDRRADRAHKINELEVRREEKLTVREVGTLFAKIVEILREKLEPKQFVLVVPHLQRLTQENRLAVAGSLEERDRHEAAAETLLELAEGIPAIEDSDDEP